MAEIEYVIDPKNINIFDQCEVYPNCTVQVLTNSITGEISIGWWINEESED